MSNVQLSPEEVAMVHEILQHRLAEIDMEIFRTDTHDFKRMLKRRKELLEQLLHKLDAEPVAA